MTVDTLLAQVRRRQAERDADALDQLRRTTAAALGGSDVDADQVLTLLDRCGLTLAAFELLAVGLAAAPAS